jgi:small subunit ribosomal protein S6
MDFFLELVAHIRRGTMSMTSEHMREYETVYIMRPEIDDKAAKDIMLGMKDLIERLGGINIKVTAMGRRRLAWERKKQQRGFFVHHNYLGKPGIVKEFERALNIDDNILLRQSMMLNGDVDPATAQVKEDQLVPPVFKERKEFQGPRGQSRYDQNDRYDRGDFSYGDTDSDDEDNPLADDE